MVVGATAPPWAASLRAGAESLTVTRHFTSESGTRPYSLRPLVPRQTTETTLEVKRFISELSVYFTVYTVYNKGKS